MKQRAEWYDTCLAVTHVFAANGYWCWWAPLHSASQAQLFWSLVLLFPSPLFPVFCLLATSNQSIEMDSEPSGTCLLSMRSGDEMKVIMGTRQPGGHLTSQVGSDIGDFSWAYMALKYICLQQGFRQKQVPYIYFYYCLFKFLIFGQIFTFGFRTFQLLDFDQACQSSVFWKAIY